MPSFDEIEQAVEISKFKSISSDELVSAQQDVFIKRLCSPSEAVKACDPKFITRRHFTADNILIRPVINEVPDHQSMDVISTAYATNSLFREITIGSTVLQCPETVMAYIDRTMLAPISSEAECIQLKLTVNAKNKIISRVSRCLHLKLSPIQVLMIVLDSLNINYEFVAFKNNKHLFKKLTGFSTFYFDFNHTVIDKRMRKEQDIRMNYSAPNPILGERKLQLSLYLETFLSEICLLIVDKNAMIPSKELSKILRSVRVPE